MKILNLVFHPNLSESRVNKTWKSQLEQSGKVTTSRDLYDLYPGFQIDVEKEQALLLEHDRIVFQLPLYWYSVPPLMKKWFDDVLTYNFAYGSKGDKLKGKDMQLLVSVGGHQRFYSGFDIYATIPELLKPFQLTANLTQMNYLHPEWMFRADSVGTETIEAYGTKFANLIDDPKRSNAKQYLNDSMSYELDEVYEELGVA